mgnify:CR=1 FL=1|jgi:cytochrome c556
MKARMIVTALAVLAAGTGLAFADAALKDNREAAMKSVGGAMGALVKIAKGEAAYDAAIVKTSLTTIAGVGKTFPALFPAADAVEDKAASPKIWENMDDFKARSAKLTADAEGLLAMLPADQAAVGASLKTLGDNCAGCHELYRLKE